MKKFISACLVMLVMAMSALPAFASVDDSKVVSPVATQPVEPTTANPIQDTSPKAPQTGSNDSWAYSVIALSVAAIGFASVQLARTKKSEK